MEKTGNSGLKRGLWIVGRLFLWILLITGVIVASVCGIATQFMLENEIYREQGEYLLDQKEEFVDHIGKRILEIYMISGMEGVNDYCGDADIRYAIYHRAGRRVGGNMSPEMEEGAVTVRYTAEDAGQHGSAETGGHGSADAGGYGSAEAGRYYVKLHVGKDVVFWDSHAMYSESVYFLIKNRYTIPILYVLGAVLAMLSAVLLVRGSSGESVLFRVPLELVTVAAGFCIWIFGRWGLKNLRLGLVEVNAVTLAIALVAVCFVIHLLSRIRKAEWYRGTLCYMLWSLVVKLLRLWKKLFTERELIWQFLIAGLAVGAAEGAAIWYLVPAGSGKNILLGVWLAEKVLLLPFLLYRALTIKKFQKAAAEMASGNLAYQIDAGQLPGTYRQFGADMNAIAAGVSLAVEDRLKSERLKTELITNVSHDIKTPLTSIINFSDLISREKTENAKITEYAGLLHKQSVKLKKLIEDLIEASKASTGNLEFSPETCEVRTLLAQCLGEYEHRLQEQNIELVVKLGTEPAWIMADPKMLWRIFENLMNNICKYSQKETRVYLNMEQRDEHVQIAFKNISKYPLDVSVDELTERFVRGDLSRHTEGYGLGLSIVKSLMDLQGGKITLAVDGDLFKAVLEFPVTQPPAQME